VSLLPEGSYYVGDKGVLLVGGIGGGGRGGRGSRGIGGLRPSPDSGLLPAAKFRDFTPPPKTIPPHQSGITRSGSRQREAARRPIAISTSPASFAETALLGVISQRIGKRLAWDAQNMRILDDADSNQQINPPYRSGWSL
jgi:hypothetical protein